MTLSGYIIERYSDMANAYTCRRLQDEARLQGIDLTIVGVNDCVVHPDGSVQSSGVQLERRDFAIMRYKKGKIKDAIARLVTRSYNRPDAFSTYVNKFEQMATLHSENFKLPKSFLSTTGVPFTQVAKHLSVPFVAKGLESSMGREIFLISNEGDFENLKKTYPCHDKEWLWQEFIAGSRGHDLRLYSLRGNAVACMERISDGDFRANVALGASVRPFAIDEQLEKIARDIYALSELDIVGIDLLFGTDSYYLCEINVMPGLEGIESASKLNIAGQVIAMIKNDFRLL